MIFGLILFMANISYAETYYVKVNVLTGKRIALFKFKDGDVLKDTDTCAYVEITKEDHDIQNSSSYEESQTQFANWKKTQVNQDKIDLAIANKPKTDKEKLAELEAKIIVLESKP